MCLIRHVVTEKSMQLSTIGIYCFDVQPLARKDEIKAAVEKAFDVKVANVNVANYKPRQKLVRRTNKLILKKIGACKRAFVKLASGTIAVFEGS